jgi:hypothetical protein
MRIEEDGLPHLSVWRFPRRASGIGASTLMALATFSALHSTELTHPALASEQIHGIIPEQEWIGVWTSHGRVTPNGLRAVEAAISVLRKHGIQPENY